MIVAGLDIGSLSTKVVIMENDRIIAVHIVKTGLNSGALSLSVMQATLDKADREMNLQDLDYIVATGYGRVSVPFSNSLVTEISCHAKANHWMFPGVRTILDMGGQDCKAIRCDAGGKVLNFVMNDKCAAGTGRYIERIARIVGVSLDEVGSRSLEIVNGTEKISSFCVLFGQRDVTINLRQGKHPNDLLAGVCEAIVERITLLLNRIVMVSEFAVSGGVAKNIGVIRRLEKKLKLKALIAPEPQIMGAIGAALYAGEKFLRHGRGQV